MEKTKSSEPLKQSLLPEAAASMTFDIMDANGFPILFTVRDTSGSALLDSLPAITKRLVAEGCKPHEKYASKKFEKKEKDFTGKMCPKDGGRLYKATTKSGKTMIKCENSKYDWATKTASGCDYIEWPDDFSDVGGKSY